MEKDNIIVTKNLVKKYGKKCAVDNISLEIKKGDIYGLIGRNGAGKTSFMKLLLGMTKITDGSIELLGGTDLEAARLRTGSIIETPTFYENMSAYKNMMYRSKLLGMHNASDKVNELLKLVGLLEVKGQKTCDYSLGMRQKLGIATALLNEPELLILDEPINGLDPVAIAEVRHVLKKVNKEQKVTIIISSHILGEMQKLATRYGFIVDGKLINEITEAEIENKKIDLESYSLKLMGVTVDE